jgi:hypothetical protein
MSRKGWERESARHKLAALGIKTAMPSDPLGGVRSKSWAAINSSKKVVRPELEEIQELINIALRDEVKLSEKFYGHKDHLLPCDDMVERVLMPMMKKRGFKGMHSEVGEMKYRLRDGNIEKVNGSEGHLWLEYKDIIIDPTADQFGFPNIVLKSSKIGQAYAKAKKDFDNY